SIAAPGVVKNDTDIDGDSLSSRVVTGPAHGTLTLNLDGSFAYNPANGYTGPDSFTYQADSGQAVNNLSNIATVLINVTRPEVITAVADSYVAKPSTTLTRVAPGVLANDFDTLSHPLSVVLVTNVQHGSLTLNADGSFSYTPNAGFTGPDSFSYNATDGL